MTERSNETFLLAFLAASALTAPVFAVDCGKDYKDFMVGLTSGRLAKMTSKGIVDLTISPLTAREAIVLSALHVGFFGVLFGLRFNVPSEVVGTTPIASTVLSAATLAASTYFTAGMGQP